METKTDKSKESVKYEGRFSLKQKVNDTPRKQPKVPQPKKEDEH